jgi:hypothetical protein
MISLCLPTRGRPELFARMVESAYDTADTESGVQVVAYVDALDPELHGYLEVRDHVRNELGRDLRLNVGPYLKNTRAWNFCWQFADGPIYMQAGDDLRFRTQGWDSAVRDAFGWPDKIGLVHLAEMSPLDAGDAWHGHPFAPHVILHDAWTETLGFLVPEWFRSDFCDVWVNELANRLGRRNFLQHVQVEHLHPTWGKRPADATDAIRENRDREGAKPGNLSTLYDELEPERARDLAKLQLAIRQAVTA